MKSWNEDIEDTRKGGGRVWSTASSCVRTGGCAQCYVVNDDGVRLRYYPFAAVEVVAVTERCCWPGI
jgi:hypothetical protein